MASIIAIMTKGNFKDTFKLKKISKGFFFADFLKNELRSGAQGIDKLGIKVDLMHDSVMVLSDHKEQMNAFGFESLSELNYKELHYSTITLDYDKELMTNEVLFLNQDNEKQKVTLETEI